MNKDFILKKRKDFLRVAQGEHVVASTVILQAAPSLSVQNQTYRVGFTATKKIGKAYVRNRTKRRLRAATDEIFPTFALPDMDYVVIGRHNTAICPYKDLRKDLKRAIKKINYIMTEKAKEKAASVQTSADITSESFIIRLAVLPIRIYQKLISPLFPGCCRFRPTCSQYMIEAIKTHGLFKGGYLGIARLLRCHPWGKSGDDPVPPVKSKKKKHNP